MSSTTSGSHVDEVQQGFNRKRAAILLERAALIARSIGTDEDPVALKAAMLEDVCRALELLDADRDTRPADERHDAVCGSKVDGAFSLGHDAGDSGSGLLGLVELDGHPGVVHDDALHGSSSSVGARDAAGSVGADEPTEEDLPIAQAIARDYFEQIAERDRAARSRGDAASEELGMLARGEAGGPASSSSVRE